MTKKHRAQLKRARFNAGAKRRAAAAKNRRTDEARKTQHRIELQAAYGLSTKGI